MGVEEKGMKLSMHSGTAWMTTKDQLNSKVLGVAGGGIVRLEYIFDIDR